MRAVSCGPQPRNDPHVRLIAPWSAAPQISDSAVMTLSLDDLPDDVETLKVMVLAIRAETEAVQTENAKLAAEHARLDQEHTVLAAEVERLTEQNERLDSARICAATTPCCRCRSRSQSCSAIHKLSVR